MEGPSVGDRWDVGFGLQMQTNRQAHDLLPSGAWRSRRLVACRLDGGGLAFMPCHAVDGHTNGADAGLKTPKIGQ